MPYEVVTPEPKTVRARILHLLADGKARTAQQIGDEIHARYGNSRTSVIVELSHIAYRRDIKRFRTDARRCPYAYRRVDVDKVSAA